MSYVAASVDEAFVAAQSLAPDQKLELITRLWEDVRAGGTFRPSDTDLAEIKRRWVEFESGQVKSIPWEQVQDEIRQKLKELKAND